MLSLAARVHPQVDEGLAKEGVDPCAATLEIRLNDGRKYSLTVDHPKSRRPNLLSDGEIRQKFRDCVAFSVDLLSQERGEEIIKVIESIDEIKDVTHITRLLTPLRTSS